MNSGTFQVLEGKVAKLVCNSTGEPTPKITWLRNGLRLETNIRYMIDKNILKIVDTRSDTDSGIYLCMAQNEAGSVQQAFTLEVLVTPKITSTSPNETIVAVGEPFSLRCGASGHPLPAITWELNNENIETSLTSEHRIEGDTLYVKELPQKGTSTFRCTVHNSAGLDEVEFIVKVIAPPILNKEGIQTLNVTKDEPTVINCDVQVDLSDSEIEWQKDGIQLSRDGNAKIDGKNLKFEKAMLNDEGTYKCIAINPAGNATQITKLHVGGLFFFQFV
uniref:Ig-like domain-containing protein n=1 Tax=Panagrolaimus superbus TaxID=310955 RepID=A0A914YDV3_9BILA